MHIPSYSCSHRRNAIDSNFHHHHHQLLRTTLEEKSTKMIRLQLPFDVVSSSLKINVVPGQVGSQELSFDVRAAFPCTVQVFWGVQHDDIGTLASIPGYLSAEPIGNSPSASDSSPFVPQVLRSLSMETTLRALRSASSRLGSRLHRQRRRHQLHDEVLPGDAAAADATYVTERVHTTVTSRSDVFRCDSDEIRLSFSIPGNAIEPPCAAELQSLVDEVDQHDPVTRPSLTTRDSRPSVGFSAVVVVRSVDLTGDSIRLKGWSKRGSKHMLDQNSNRIISQCVAIDFLPTPFKLERLTPAVVKKINYTQSTAFVAQEIYGRDTCSECVICLESPAAVVLLPCRHFCVCRSCLQEIDRCPICRTAFAMYVSYSDITEESPRKV